MNKKILASLLALPLVLPAAYAQETSGFPAVKVSGFGTGALKNFVHHFLKNHDLVDRYAFASPDQGGHGATVAEIKL